MNRFYFPTRSVAPLFLTLAALATLVVSGSSGEAQAQTPAPAAQAQQALLNPNSATRAQLLTVPNVSGTVADAVVRGRPYTDMVAVDRILVAAALTEEQRDAVYARLFLPLDLNTATDEEILLIPGIGNRMLREFREYRPYRTIAQFSREMGKYVDNAEVSRLEKYVSIRP